MAKYLKLYSNLTPNIEGGIFTVCEKSENLLNCYKNYEIKTLTLDNYRINNNVATINGNISGITYVIDYEENDGNITYICCYNVVSETLQSGYTILGLKMDLWNTYISDTKINYGNVIKCNKNINDFGIYDAITTTDGKISVNNNYDYLDSSMISIVFLLEYNIVQSVFGGDGITKTQLFCANLQELKDLINTSGDYDNTSALNIAIDLIGGIYTATSWGSDNDARVLQSWLIPNELLNTSANDGTYNIKVNTKSVYAPNGKEITIKTVMPSHYRKEINFNITDDDLSKCYYAGTYNNGIKLTRFTSKTLNYYYIVLVGQSDIKVIIQDGENQKDITNGFEVSLTTNATETTTLREIAKAYSLSVNTAKSSVKAYATSGVSGAVLNVGQTVANMVSPENYNSAIGGGDGYLTYFIHNPEGDEYNKVKSPYVLYYVNSILNEGINASYNGASFSEVVKDVSIYSLLEKYENEKTAIYNGSDRNVYSFVKITGSYSNIPLEALNFIKQQLNNGINYFTYYNGATK